MRLVFYHPQTARIGHHLREFVRFKSHGAYRKYHFFIPLLFNKKEAAIFLDCRGKSAIYSLCKAYIWMIINGISVWDVRVLSKQKQLDPTQDVLLSFPFLSSAPHAFTQDSVFSRFQGVKFFHFSHYFCSTEQVCSYIKSLQNALIIGDGNLKINPLYKRFMGSQPFYSLPFALKNRYQSRVAFNARKNKCFAFGTKSKMCPKAHKEFMEILQTDYLHSLRSEIFQRKTEIIASIDSFIFDYEENSDFSAKGPLEKLSQYISKKIGNDRKRFFSIDIVQKYNEYKMFVSPEEESGAPSISFIEGMACGCAYFGRPEFYTDFGMIPGVHFIPYDGTLEGLIREISYYQMHPEVTAEIAKSGREFVMQYFKPETVAETLWSRLEKTLGDYASTSD